MGVSRGAVAALAISMVLLGSASAAENLDDQRRKVAAAEARVAALQRRVAGLLSEISRLQEEVATSSAALGVGRIRVERAVQRTAEAEEILRRRVRQAYKQRGMTEIALITEARSLSQLLSAWRYLRDSIQADSRALESLQDQAEELAGATAVADVDRSGMLRAQRDLVKTRARLAAALESAQRALDRDREALRILEARRAALSSGVSPAVEARRRARQVILDRKLQALLDWYAPGYGPEPFMPEVLQSTGVVSRGLSSWYGPGFHGRRASSGATFRQEQLTAASRVLPFGTLLKVTFRDRAVVVVITDRGPYIPGRVLDLSAGAAQAIGLTGVQQVRMEIVVPTGDAPEFP